MEKGRDKHKNFLLKIPFPPLILLSYSVQGFELLDCLDILDRPSFESRLEGCKRATHGDATVMCLNKRNVC